MWENMHGPIQMRLTYPFLSVVSLHPSDLGGQKTKRQKAEKSSPMVEIPFPFTKLC